MFAVRLVHVLNTYRIHVVLLYALLLWLYVGLAGVANKETSIAVASFTALLCGAYLINKSFNVHEDAISQPHEVRSSPFLFWSAIICMAIPLVVLFLLKLPAVPYVCFLLISLGYSVPIGTFRIKSVPLLKNIYAAGSWYASVVVILVWYGAVAVSIAQVAVATLSVFFIALTYELLWDIRDKHGDGVAGHKTIPVLFGILPTKILMLGSLGVAWYFTGFSIFPITLLMLGYLAFTALVVRENFPPSYYHATVYVLIAILTINILGL